MDYTKYFDGKRYAYVNSIKTNPRLNRVVFALEKQGYKTRTVKEGGKYLVYYRNKNFEIGDKRKNY